MDQVRFGVVGLGNMGGVHARQHLPQMPRAELAAVCDIDPARLAGFNVPTFADSAEMIRSGLIDAIIVATPHFSHTTIGIDALENGLHVLVEKPISVHKADAQRLIDAYERQTKKPVFGAMFNQRTDPHYQTIRSLVQSGELGEVRRINWIITNWFRTAAYYASGGWRATWGGEGGGVLLNQCPHNLDLYQWLFGMPTEIRAFCQFGRFHSIEVEDSVTAFLQHPNGATGVFVTTTGESPGTNRLEVVGDRGKLVYEDGKIRFDRATVSIQEFSDTTPQLFTDVPVWHCDIPIKSYGGQHLEILNNFTDAILDGSSLVSPAVEGIRSVELANAMIFSALEDRTISLPIDAEAYEARLQDLIKNSRHQKRVVEAVAADMSQSF